MRGLGGPFQPSQTPETSVSPVQEAGQPMPNTTVTVAELVELAGADLVPGSPSRSAALTFLPTRPTTSSGFTWTQRRPRRDRSARRLLTGT